MRKYDGVSILVSVKLSKCLSELPRDLLREKKKKNNEYMKNKIK